MLFVWTYGEEVTKTKDFKVSVSFRVNLADLPKGVELTKQNVIAMVESALVNYTNDMADEGYFTKDEQAIAASMPEFEVK